MNAFEKKKIITDLIKKYYPSKILLDAFDKPFSKILDYYSKLKNRNDGKFILFTDNHEMINLYKTTNKKIKKNIMNRKYDFAIIYNDRIICGNFDVDNENLIKSIDDNDSICVVCYEEQSDSKKCYNCGKFICLPCYNNIFIIELNKLDDPNLNFHDKLDTIKNYIQCPYCRSPFWSKK